MASSDKPNNKRKISCFKDAVYKITKPSIPIKHKYKKTMSNGVVLHNAVREVVNNLNLNLIDDIKKEIALYTVTNIETYNRSYGNMIDTDYYNIHESFNKIIYMKTLDNEICILYKPVASESNEYVVKKYNAQNGDLLHAFNINHHISTVDIYNNTVYTLSFIDNDWCVMIYNIHFKAKKIVLSDSDSINSQSIIKTYDNICCITYNNCINIYSLNVDTFGHYLQTHTINTISHINSMCIDNSNIYIYNNTKSCIYICNIDSDDDIAISHKINLYNSIYMYDYGTYMDVCDNEIYISDWNNDRIVVHNMSGVKLREFGNEKKWTQSLHAPKHVSVYNGEVFVLNGTSAYNSISVYS